MELYLSVFCYAPCMSPKKSINAFGSFECFTPMARLLLVRSLRPVGSLM